MTIDYDTKIISYHSKNLWGLHGFMGHVSCSPSPRKSGVLSVGRRVTRTVSRIKGGSGGVNTTSESWSDHRCGSEGGVRVLGVWMVSWDHRDSIHHLRGGGEGDLISWYESVQECGFLVVSVGLQTVGIRV